MSYRSTLFIIAQTGLNCLPIAQTQAGSTWAYRRALCWTLMWSWVNFMVAFFLIILYTSRSNKQIRFIQLLHISELGKCNYAHVMRYFQCFKTNSSNFFLLVINSPDCPDACVQLRATSNKTTSFMASVCYTTELIKILSKRVRGKTNHRKHLLSLGCAKQTTQGRRPTSIIDKYFNSVWFD